MNTDKLWTLIVYKANTSDGAKSNESILGHFNTFDELKQRAGRNNTAKMDDSMWEYENEKSIYLNGTEKQVISFNRMLLFSGDEYNKYKAILNTPVEMPRSCKLDEDEKLVYFNGQIIMHKNNVYIIDMVYTGNDDIAKRFIVKTELINTTKE